VIPAGGKLAQEDLDFIHGLERNFVDYIDFSEKVKIKDALKVAMTNSHLCNGYFQDSEPWVLSKSNPERCAQVLNVAANALFLITKMLEPFIPSFSAKVYEQLNIQVSERDEKIFEFLLEGVFVENFGKLVAAGHKIGEPQPIFREIIDEEVDTWKQVFDGKKAS